MSTPVRIEAAWLRAPGPQAVSALLAGAGRRALFVGGCVRDALLGRDPADVDLATDAWPDEVMALADAAGLKAVPTGVAHGTVTLVYDGAPIEVTTFRRDVASDGRRALVAFTADVGEDAARRDFTINALYAEADGAVVDPLGALPDLRARRVRFVGDPVARIAEDHLRILRFFRFHAWYATGHGGLDAAGLAACAAGAAGIAKLSRERVGSEMARLLAAPDPALSVAAMASSGVLERALPGAEIAALAPLTALEAQHGAAPSWRRRLAALGARRDWPERLRLSAADAGAIDTIRAALAADEPAAASAYRFGAEATRDAALIRAARGGPAPPDDLEAAIARGAGAIFPLRGHDLALEGPSLGVALRRAEAAWIASDFVLDTSALRQIAAP